MPTLHTLVNTPEYGAALQQKCELDHSTGTRTPTQRRPTLHRTLWYASCCAHPRRRVIGVESSASSHRKRTVARRNIMATGSPPYNVRIERTRHINAPVDRVAAVLENTARAPEWNPLL